MQALRLTFATLTLLLPLSGLAQDKLEYNRDIRPIFADTCFKCHGPDSAARQADLRVDLRETAIDMGVIVPGKPEESAMIERIFSDDPDLLMPPPASHKKLTDKQKNLLKRWIAEGAEYQPHWSFIAPVKSELPQVKNEAWVRNPIDRFILQRLEQEEFTPAAEADQRTLARRVALDLTGLPPNPELVEEFVKDNSPDAYEKFVDKLLATSQWGEHRGRYWLDYARYADTHGIHFDNFREMWSYRDWVIDAFNKNMPYDQFTIENLAGDLLPDRTLEQQIASGFNRCNMTTNEGGIIDEEYKVLYARDRTETTSLVWMGLTVGCCTCHDHKFDPVSQREFYGLSAFFNNTTQPVRDGNVKDTPPIIRVPLEADAARFEALKSELPAALQTVEARKTAARPEFDKWLAAVTPEQFEDRIPTEKLSLHAPLNEGEGKQTKIVLEGESQDLSLTESAAWEKGYLPGSAVQISKGGIAEISDVGDFDTSQPFSCSAWVKVPANDGSGAIVSRMNNGDNYRGWDFWMEGRRVGTHIIAQWNADAVKVVSKEQIPANKWVHVAFTYDGSAKAAGVKVYIDGKQQQTNVQADSLKGSIKTTVPFKIGQRNTSDPISGIALQDLRIYTRALALADVESLSGLARYAGIVAKPADQRTDQEKQDLYNYWLPTFDEPFRSLTATVEQLQREEADIHARGTIAHVMQEKPEEAMAFVLFRGDYDKPRDQVTAGTPEILPPFPEEFPRNRLGLAQWLLLDDHPLTARVTVNRFWQEVFGTGLVKSSGDFGVSGDQPSHPELLDWLAIDFRESGWDVKRFFKQIVMSSTYRQAATSTPEKREKDPENRLLARGPRFRMDAEMVRDHALAASGLLVGKIGGPSVKPYQPPGVWEAIAMNVSNTRSYEPETGENLYRRSMYWFWKRMAPPASMDILNAPNREYCVIRRERTNTPLQALVTLNDEQFVEAARHLASRSLTEGGNTFDQRIDFIAKHLLARPLRAEEKSIVKDSQRELADYYSHHKEDAQKLIEVGESKPDASLDPAELAAWTMLTNQLMNLDEVLCK
ncbi:MAG TPA: DUF1553 domain-containing protein [Planctomycetaceae bacterium]|nr:DUF1553 domain-containing protein [Planctomycetaceae bacterium]